MKGSPQRHRVHRDIKFIALLLLASRHGGRYTGKAKQTSAASGILFKLLLDGLLSFFAKLASSDWAKPKLTL
jgi:hypothetical protein